MKEKNTGELYQALMEEPDLNSYLSGSREFFREHTPDVFFAELLSRREISKAALARKSGMSEVYLHQVLSGRRTPSRDRALCLCIGLEASLDETQELLKRTGYGQLYPKRRRDAMIAHGLVHHTPLDEINDALYAENEKTLF